MSLEIQSGFCLTCKNSSQNRCIHWFLMATVGANTSVGLSSRMATSSPNTVLPEPGGAMMCRWLSSRCPSNSSSTRSWYFLQSYLNFMSEGNCFKSVFVVFQIGYNGFTMSRRALEALSCQPSRKLVNGIIVSFFTVAPLAYSFCCAIGFYFSFLNHPIIRSLSIFHFPCSFNSP